MQFQNSVSRCVLNGENSTAKVNIMLWFNFIVGSNFIFHCSVMHMVMYDNEFKTKENKI